MIKRICIFCGANPGHSQRILNQAKQLADLLAQAGCGLVYGGGDKGLMGIVASRFLQYGREVIGVRPRLLIENEDAHTGLSQLIEVDSMQERKTRMVELSDAFVALPGGIGTLDEVIETYTLLKIGFVQKPSVLLNTDGFYDATLAQLKVMSRLGFLSDADRQRLGVAESPQDLMEVLKLNAPFAGDQEIDKVAFLSFRAGKVLVARSRGKEKFYLPGGKREAGESDESTLVREVQEELSVAVDSDTAIYYGTFVAQADGKASGVQVRMTCYEAGFQGTFSPASEIEALAWLDSSDMDQVAAVDQLIFAQLRAEGRLN